MSEEARTEQKRLHILSLYTLLRYGSNDSQATAANDLRDMVTSTTPYVTPEELANGFLDIKNAEKAISRAFDDVATTNTIPHRHIPDDEPIKRNQRRRLL